MAIGVQLLPGAAQALLGMPAGELTGQHARLDDLWDKSEGYIFVAAQHPKPQAG